MAGLGFEAAHHFAQHGFEALDRNLILVHIEDFDEPGHVGALEIVGQSDIHVEGGNGVTYAATLVQHLERMPDVLDADLVDRQLARIGGALNVCNN